MSTGRTVVGMAAEEGLEHGIALLEALRSAGAETHLVLTAEAAAALGTGGDAVRALADRVYATENQAARISSGSFLTQGMVVAPCDTRSLAAVTMGLATNLVYRAADVTLKEGRPLVLGLVGRAGTGEAEAMARAAGIPGMAVLRLDGPVDDAVGRLLEALARPRLGAR